MWYYLPRLQKKYSTYKIIPEILHATSEEKDKLEKIKLSI